jgi:hypothetical protein
MRKSAVLIAAVVLLAAAGVATYLAWPSSSRAPVVTPRELPICKATVTDLSEASQLAAKAYCENRHLTELASGVTPTPASPSRSALRR